ncbi:hypothetical protein SAMN00120144_4092 [Hymenobacter roseosalivarius DSM 11622]|uniref:Uncharacterized protein n=1 Tax=Hymenobacter roseosalivarius DSM 11622 TaxID=645990 RepID=A0A1W1W5A7_9BACT|nr:hypothetical protein SAMN00120144_4092 [Hymenobacter roseosalivarius DSM 11622]
MDGRWVTLDTMVWIYPEGQQSPVTRHGDTLLVFHHTVPRTNVNRYVITHLSAHRLTLRASDLDQD